MLIFYDVYIYCTILGVYGLFVVQNLQKDFIKHELIENSY